MKKIKMIVAMDQNNVIGNNGGMPDWDLKLDRAFFRDITTGHSIILGRKNYKSIEKPLPNRTNIVLTKNKLWDPQNSHVVVVHSLWNALQKAEEAPGDTIWIIGGSDIYTIALEKLLIDEIYITHIFGVFDGDTYFPHIDQSIYKYKLKVHDIIPDAKNSHYSQIIKYWR